MDGDAIKARQQHVTDWLEQAVDLPHLLARVSELVHCLGYAAEDLVVLPRAELDRRELAAYRAGWADVVEEGLPTVRRAYEERITAAYLQGQADARTGRRPRRARRPEGEEGGEVIPLPYLHRPPPEPARAERERPAADRVPAPPEESGAGGPGAADGDPTPSVDFLLSAREVREKRGASVQRRPVVRRRGRPSVPPLPPRRPADEPQDRTPDRHGSCPEAPGG
ncbi:hypothetical protein [Streptomyces sp. NPDC053367]|uniref:hypothetical protein n=1 Tax=Streptomyces sp. NPDC053367 TaxID=3365700 RepID=UPI0037D31DB6